MSDILVNDVDRADALVDLSNVLRNTRLGGYGTADLVRLERVGAALNALYESTEAAMLGVADSSLLTAPGLFLDHRQRRTLRDWGDTGLIQATGKADDLLLQIAEETGLPIITGDRFGGYRYEYPWLNDSDDAVLEPRVDHYGNVFLQHVTLERREAWMESRSIEKDLLVQQGLTGKVEVLGRYWSCPEPRCARHDPANRPFILLPLLRRGRLVCEQHDLVMVDLGPRPRVAQLKIMLGGQVKDRFLVTAGQPVTVGRSGQGIDVSPFVDGPALSRVSRTHLRFNLDADCLTITDESRNGTKLILRDGSRINFRRATRSFNLGDRAQICQGLEIIRSGRRYPTELAADRAYPQGPFDSPTGQV
jgi:hypothetical protein